MRVELTAAAADMVRRVQAQGRGHLVMVLGNGCCDSTAPYLYDDYLTEPGSQPVGDCEGIPVVASGWLAKLYPDDEPWTVDVERVCSTILSPSRQSSTAGSCFALVNPDWCRRQLTN